MVVPTREDALEPADGCFFDDERLFLESEFGIWQYAARGRAEV